MRGIRIDRRDRTVRRRVTVGAGEIWDDVVAELTAAGLRRAGDAVRHPGLHRCHAGAERRRLRHRDRRRADRRHDLRPAHRRDPARFRPPNCGWRTGVPRCAAPTARWSPTSRCGSPTGRSPSATANWPGPLASSPAAAHRPRRFRQAVLGLRRAKGMVLDPDDPDTYSAGSFFTNPILDAEQAAAVDAAIRASARPRRDATRATRSPDSRRRTAGQAVGGLADRAGRLRARGIQGPGGRVAVSSKHTLALTNRGGSTADLIALAREIRDGVRDRVRGHAAPGAAADRRPAGRLSRLGSVAITPAVTRTSRARPTVVRE